MDPCLFATFPLPCMLLAVVLPPATGIRKHRGKTVLFKKTHRPWTIPLERIEWYRLWTTVSFIWRNYECWYIKHLGSFELTSDNFSVHQLSEINDTVSLKAYTIDGHVMLTQKGSIFVRDLKEVHVDFSLSYEDPDLWRSSFVPMLTLRNFRRRLYWKLYDLRVMPV